MPELSRESGQVDGREGLVVVEVGLRRDVGPPDGRKVLHQCCRLLDADELFELREELMSLLFGDGHRCSLDAGVVMGEVIAA